MDRVPDHSSFALAYNDHLARRLSSDLGLISHDVESHAMPRICVGAVSFASINLSIAHIPQHKQPQSL